MLIFYYIHEYLFIYLFLEFLGQKGISEVDVENRILRKVFKNPQLTVEQSSSVDRSIVEMTFAVKSEPTDEEMESAPSLQTVSNLQDSSVTLENYTLDYFINSSAPPQASQVSVSDSSQVRLIIFTNIFIWYFLFIQHLVIFRTALAQFMPWALTERGGKGGGGP